jgi:hypothetical protein
MEVTSELTANCHSSLLSILKSHEDSEEDKKKKKDQSVGLEKANVKHTDKVFRFCECK